MGKDGHLTQAKLVSPSLSRALHLHLQPATRLTWVGAGWAALCGIIAAGVPQLSVDTVARGLLTLVLADPVLGSAWAALFEVGALSRDAALNADRHATEPVKDGRVSLEPRTVKLAPLVNSQRVDEGQPAAEELKLEPAPATSGASVPAGFDGRSTSQLFGGDSLQPVDEDPAASNEAGASFVEAGLLYGLALLLALVLGRGVAVVVGVGLVFPLVVWFALGRHPLRAGWVRATLEIGLSWAIGLAAFTALPASDLGGLSGLTLSTIQWAGDHVAALGVGVLFVIAYYGKLALLDRSFGEATQRVFLTLPQVAVVALLVVWRQPILAGIAAVFVLSQMLFQGHLSEARTRWYLRDTQWLFLGTMLVAAIGLAVHHA